MKKYHTQGRYVSAMAAADLFLIRTHRLAPQIMTSLDEFILRDTRLGRAMHLSWMQDKDHTHVEHPWVEYTYHLNT